MLPAWAGTDHRLRVQAEGACVVDGHSRASSLLLWAHLPSSPWEPASRRQADDLRFLPPPAYGPQSSVWLQLLGLKVSLSLGEVEGSWCIKGLQTSFCISVPKTCPFQGSMGPRKLPEGSRGLEPALLNSPRALGPAQQEVFQLDFQDELPVPGHMTWPSLADAYQPSE